MQLNIASSNSVQIREMYQQPH